MEKVSCFFWKNNLAALAHFDRAKQMLASRRYGHMLFLLIIVDESIHRDIVKFCQSIAVKDIGDCFPRLPLCHGLSGYADFFCYFFLRIFMILPQCS